MVAYLLSVGSIVLQGTPQAIKDEGRLLNVYLGGGALNGTGQRSRRAVQAIGQHPSHGRSRDEDTLEDG
jgi:hypothetical protein